MQKAKKGRDDLTRTIHRNRRACKTEWVSGRFPVDSTQDVWDGLSDVLKSYLSKSVASIALCDGDTILFSCSGIAMECQGYNLRFLTTAGLVRVMNGTNKGSNGLKIEVRHEGDEVCIGSLAEFDLHRNFAVVAVSGFDDVQFGPFQRALETLPHGKVVVAVGRGVNGKIMAKSVELNSEAISEDDEDLHCKTSEVWEGGPLLFVDHVVGMNLFLTKRKAIFRPWDIILKHLEGYSTSQQQKDGLAQSKCLKVYSFGARPLGEKSITYPHTVQGHYYFKDLSLDLDSKGYPKLPSTMLGADMILVNTFEETFGNTYDKGVWKKFNNGASNIRRNIVALASFTGGKRFFVCTGFFVEWIGSPIILTSASLVRKSNDDNTIVENFKLLFPTADAALPSSMLSIGGTLISGICVALALCIAVLRGSKNRFFNCTFLRYTFSLTETIIIMNWFQAAQPALQYVASGVIGFVTVQRLWNGEVKQPMGKVWDGGEDDATALPEDRGDFPEDGSSTGSDHGDRDHGDGPEDGSSSGSDEDTARLGPCAVQLLSIRANFRVRCINAFDWRCGHYIYMPRVGEVQEDGMADLVPIGPYKIIEAYGAVGFEVYPNDGTNDVFEEECDVIMEDDEVEERTLTIDVGLGRKLEITYLVMPDAIETHVEVKLNLKDLGSRSRNVYGSIKASAIDYGSKNVHLFSCCRDRERSLSFPCGSTCVVPLSPFVIALPYRRHFKLRIEVDLKVTTTCDSQDEGKNLKFCLDFTRRVTSQEREVDGDQVEVNVTWYLDRISA